ncbi:MAG: hypothetical protein ACOYCD_03070 [Kiritimatiellia bacterium]|jgi:hypothetical protein
MISCTEFIPAYSELFKFLEERGGREAVIKFWEHLSDVYLTNLRDLAASRGLRGCWDYWAHTLNEEAADFTMELDEDAGELRGDMRHCPSKGRLLTYKHMQPYPHYCDHCDLLYRRVLEPLGFEYDIDLSQCDQARCRFTVRKKTPATKSE